MAFIGPTPEHMRYAVRGQLEDLEDKIRLCLLKDKNLYFNSLELRKPSNKTHFALLTLRFYRNHFEKLDSYDIELSNKYLPHWLNPGSQHDSIIFQDVYDVLNLWALNNIPLF